MKKIFILKSFETYANFFYHRLFLREGGEESADRKLGNARVTSLQQPLVMMIKCVPNVPEVEGSILV